MGQQYDMSLNKTNNICDDISNVKRQYTDLAPLLTSTSKRLYRKTYKNLIQKQNYKK